MKLSILLNPLEVLATRFSRNSFVQKAFEKSEDKGEFEKNFREQYYYCGYGSPCNEPFPNISGYTFHGKNDKTFRVSIWVAERKSEELFLNVKDLSDRIYNILSLEGN